MGRVNQLFQDEQQEQLVEFVGNILVDVQISAIHIAQGNNQTVGEKNDFYITLQQLEAILNKVSV